MTRSTVMDRTFFSWPTLQLCPCYRASYSTWAGSGWTLEAAWVSASSKQAYTTHRINLYPIYPPLKVSLLLGLGRKK